MNAHTIESGLTLIDALDKTELNAFLALFAGARFPWYCHDGRPPFMGKAECERVQDWRDFYGRRLKDAGLFRFEEGPPFPLLGMSRNDNGTYRLGTEIECGPTALAWDVREAFYNRGWGEG